MNQLDFWRADVDSKNVKVGLQVFSWTLSEFRDFKISCISRATWPLSVIFLHADLEYRKVKGDLKIFSHELV